MTSPGCVSTLISHLFPFTVVKLRLLVHPIDSVLPQGLNQGFLHLQVVMLAMTPPPLRTGYPNSLSPVLMHKLETVLKKH